MVAVLAIREVLTVAAAVVLLLALLTVAMIKPVVDKAITEVAAVALLPIFLTVALINADVEADVVEVVLVAVEVAQNQMKTLSNVMFNSSATANPEIEAFEDKCITKNKGRRAEKGELALRPGYGVKGASVVMRANLFEARFHGADWFHYAVRVRPDPQNTRLNREIFKELMGNETIRKAHAATDGAQVIVAMKNLLPGSPYEVTIDGSLNAAKRFSVELTLTEKVNPSELVSTLNNIDVRTHPPNGTSFLQIMNILMSAHPFRDTGVTTIRSSNGNKVFWTDGRKQAADLQGGIECIRGFNTSARICDNRIFINLGVNHSSFFHQGPLHNILTLFNAMNPDQPPDYVLFNRYINRLRVDVTHLEKRMECGVLVYKQRSIWGLAWPQKDGRTHGTHPKTRAKIVPDANPPRFLNENIGATADEVSFFRHDKDANGKSLSTGKYVTVTQHFKEEYNLKLKYHDWPVVNVGSFVHPIYIPLDPPNNFKSIMQDGRRIMGMDNPLKSIDTEFKPEMITLNARILPPPILKYGKSKTLMPKEGSWNLRGQQFCRPAEIKNCMGVVYTRGSPSSIDMDLVKKAFDSLAAEGKNLGMRWSAWNQGIHTRQIGRTPAEWINQLELMFDHIRKNPVDLVVIALPAGEERFFDHLKWLSETKAKVMTHCCLYSKFVTHGRPENSQYNANNVMKINLKMGGDNQTLKNAPRMIEGGTTMVVGLDVTHPSPTDPEGFPSMACIVASTDKSMGQWPGEVMVQEARKEEIGCLKAMMLGRLQHWKTINKALPNNILVYRDGVSDGQFNMVLKDELPQIQEAVTSLYGGNGAKITIVVAGKRHNVRFYPTQFQFADQRHGPKSGLVVDRGVTRPKYWDFYMQAQAPLQGSARPAHYIVIHDEIFSSSSSDSNPADTLQQLTHEICYMMGRCTRSVGYATPAFLADKYCDRARRYMRAFYYYTLIKEGKDKKPDNHRAIKNSDANNAMAYI
ncbi:hypothetical protein N7523_002423 [Penicillium sp. IBT 18751x]|nr:hypothetical protein N7523_002423 [Penicillium sp. IBT 18751x]